MPTICELPTLDLTFRLGADAPDIVGVRVNGRSLPVEVVQAHFSYLTGRAPLISMTVRVPESGDEKFASKLIQELESMGVRVTLNID